MDTIVSSLNRVEGQIRGIKKMYEEDRDCAATVQQIAAARSGLKKVAQKLLTSEAVKCSNDPASKDELKQIIENLMKVS